MKWRNAFIAAFTRRFLCDCPDSTANCQKASAGDCHTALNTSQKRLRAETPNLERRAYRLNNRNKAAAEKYLQTHQKLGKEVYSNEAK